MHKLLRVVLPCALLAIGGAWWALARRTESTNIQGARTVGSSVENSNASSLVDGPENALEDPSIADSGVRTAGETSDIPLRVLDVDGRAVAGAEVTWTPFPSADRMHTPWTDLDWSQLDARTRATTTGEDGSCSLAQLDPDPDSEGSAIWVTHPRYVAQQVIIERHASPQSIPSTVTLSSASALTVETIGADDEPVGGASVVQAFDLDRADPRSTDPSVAARRVFRRRAVTDAQGHATLRPLPARAWVQAELDHLMSEPWVGDCPAHVRLQLSSTFTVQGRVEVPAGQVLERSMYVRCAVQRAGELVALLTHVPLSATATWGPVSLPVRDVEKYVFLLEGGSFAQSRVSIDPPAPGSLINVDFHPEVGVALEIRVVGPENQDLEGSVVSVNWNQAGVWHILERTTGSDGKVRFSECQPNWIYIRARCRGFAPRLMDAIELSQALREPIVVRLDHSGRIRGRCVHAGKPVTDFRVRLWQGELSNANKVDFRDRADGSFDIDEAPLGEVTIMAYTEELPRSTPQSLTIEREKTTEVVLELPSPLNGRGRVVDARTSEPLAGASLQLYLLFQNTRLRLWGPVIRSGTDGSFRITGLAIGHNALMVSAPGYANRIVYVTIRDDEEHDFGAIGLPETVAVQIQLIHDGSTDCTQYSVELTGGLDYGTQRFPSSGFVKFDGIDPGFYQLRVVLIPEGTTFQQLLELQSGKNNRLEIPLNSRQLAVHVLPPPGESIPEGAWLGVAFRTSAGRYAADQNFHLPRDGRIDIPRPEGDEVVFRVDDVNDAPLAIKVVQLSPDSPNVVEIPLQSGAHNFRVVDRSGAPLDGAQLNFSLPEMRVGWGLSVQTNSRGEVSVKGMPPGRYMLSLFHHALGARPAEPLDLGERSNKAIELVLDPTRALRVALLERTRVAAGVSVYAEDSHGMGLGLGEAFTDAAGNAEWNHVSTGEYRVFVRHPGFWPTIQEVHLGEGDARTECQVRRVGNIDLTVVDEYGSPTAGVAVDLISVEQGISVSKWIEDGLVSRPSQGLQTDGAGKLRIVGIPNGSYRWRIFGSGGSSTDGELTVPPQATGSAELRLR